MFKDFLNKNMLDLLYAVAPVIIITIIMIGQRGLNRNTFNTEISESIDKKLLGGFESPRVSTGLGLIIIIVLIPAMIYAIAYFSGFAK